MFWIPFKCVQNFFVNAWIYFDIFLLGLFLLSTQTSRNYGTCAVSFEQTNRFVRCFNMIRNLIFYLTIENLWCKFEDVVTFFRLTKQLRHNSATAGTKVKTTHQLPPDTWSAHACCSSQKFCVRTNLLCLHFNWSIADTVWSLIDEAERKVTAISLVIEPVYFDCIRIFSALDQFFSTNIGINYCRGIKTALSVLSEQKKANNRRRQTNFST